MKPFNLERALAGDPVGTRGGESNAVHIFHADKAKPSHRVIAVLDNGFTKVYHEDGKVGAGESDIDLVMLPKTRTYWYAIHWDLDTSFLGKKCPVVTGLFEDTDWLVKHVGIDDLIKLNSIDIEVEEDE